MKKMILLFSHEMTDDQIENARERLGVEEFVRPPRSIQEMWSGVPPHAEYLGEYLNPVYKWLEGTTSASDHLLVQGDFGAVYLMVNRAFALGLIPVYATTERRARDVSLPDGSTRTEHIFRHCMFRRYEEVISRQGP